MPANLFSVPIFLICFREVLEAAIILSVLLALIEQIVRPQGHSPTPTKDQLSIETPRLPRLEENLNESHLELESIDSRQATHPIPGILKNHGDYRDRIIKRMRVQVFSGTFVGLFLSLCIGAGFLAVYYTKFTDIYGNAEELWEGIFSLIASGMIFVMGITMMRMERSKIKWRLKLSKAFEQENIIDVDGKAPKLHSKFRTLLSMLRVGGSRGTNSADSTSSRYILFFLPALTVLREGLEAVVFIGGVSLGQPATSIPIAAVTGILLGLGIGYAIYNSSARLNLSLFLMISTIALMYVGAGLITKAAWYFKMYTFIRSVGGDAAEAGDGPGSFPVDGYIWHLDYGNPENKLAAGGWMIFAGVFGWNNTGSILTVMIYISFWLIASATLIFMKWHEGRCTIFNISSAARKARLGRLDHGGKDNQLKI
ncbi:high-affinity iron permease [Puccinia graminis f. sp. tritici]|uniref:High-affinity iron permease n=1 Tax=Puccinia graminis f. sp. tritici TaxID=56615 RepID=A0A5B0NL37_PUCGR|nr:high-affinity iron permease [Puccinia graminis f. sp. tritici]